MIGFLPAMAQQYSSLWQPVTGAVASKTEQVLHPTTFQTYRTSEQQMKAFLAAVPQEAEKAQIIDLPAPDGTYQSFRIWQTPAMAKALADKYPGIYTFTASAVNNSMITAKIDYTQFGFHALIFNGANTYFVDPYGTAADGNYISYYKRDYPHTPGATMPCLVKDQEEKELGLQPESMTNDGLPPLNLNKVNGTTKRKYRLAMACTGEYAVAVNGPTPTKAGVLAKIVTTVNRVNGVYEREFSYTMELIANTDDAIFLDGTTDPYTNNNGTTMLMENQNTLSSVIGLGNFDIGHVLSTGGGGIASKGCVCNNNFKAQGVTGDSNPQGSNFDIDYVAHEMGHQFGGDHTFNNNTAGSCSGNAVQSYAYEPGSGSTVMAYAGICGGGNDYQSHSDFYFSSPSMEQITTYIASTSCAVTSTSSNNNATMGTFNATYNIPYLTPFELTGPAATDGTADSLTYSWEERDRGRSDFGKTLAQTRLQGPMFRPYPPKTTTTRVFPRIENVIANILSNNAEKLPDTARTLCFRYTQRDIYQGFGCWNIPTDSIKLNVIYTPSLFRVTSPTGAVTWGANTTQAITWDVANTTAAPISCANVDIFMSVDGGFTYPYTLATNTPNDGSQSVTIPNVNTTKMRIKVKGAGNVFFAINGTNSTVNNGVGVGTLPTAPEVTISPVPATEAVQISINSKETFNARIVNSVGQSVWQGNISGNISVPVASWAKGIYYVHMTNVNGAQSLSRKLVVQ